MLLLDSEGVSLLIRRDPALHTFLRVVTESGHRIATSAATVVEGTNPEARKAAVEFGLAAIDVLEVTKPIALTATDLLRSARRHGHQHALDAILCATALTCGESVQVLTSDPKDIRGLLSDQPHIGVIPIERLKRAPKPTR
jgi:predicted nucleic acid-binding protein